jgi:Tol biopolymer transport system component
MATKQIEPDLDTWKQEQERQRRASRNRRFGALALVVAFALIVSMLAWASRRDAEQVVVGSPSISIPTLAPDEQDVEIVDLQGNPQALVPGLPDDAYGLSLSSDGTKIAFATSGGVPHATIAHIATIGIDGTGRRDLPTEGIVVASLPAWSPDGKKIAFEGRVAEGGASDIYVMNADGSGLRKLTDDPAYDQQPQWSPDGATIVYDNTGDQPNPDDPTDPAFSPRAEIWTVPAGGGNPTLVTHNGSPDNAPSYSRDGRIAWFCYGICVMDPDGRRSLTSAPPRLLGKVIHYDQVADGFTPRWSPDGTKIAYATYDDRYRPSVPFHKDAPLVIVSVLDLRTGQSHTVGDVGMATDWNTPQWVDDSHLLIRRVGFP